MKTTFIFILLLITIPTFNQNILDSVFVKYNNSETDEVIYKTDTIYFPSAMRRNMIFGTTIWPSSSNQFSAYWSNGIRFDKIELSDCIGQVEEFDTIKTGITKIIIKDSIWIIKAVISDNCCYSFLCDIKVIKNILELDYYGYGTNYCDCDCLFELTYTLSLIDLNKSKNIDYVQLLKNNKTIKKINKP
jgi:hypothetical protein